MVANAPIAADSVGVAHPTFIDATTTRKIERMGITYFMRGLILSQPW